MAQIKITITIEADLMRDAHTAVDAMDKHLRERGGRVVSGKLNPVTAKAAGAEWQPCEVTALTKWIVLYTRIPTNYNDQKMLIVEARSAEDAWELAKDYLGDRGKTFATYSIDKVKPHEAITVPGRVIGGAS